MENPRRSTNSRSALNLENLANMKSILSEKRQPVTSCMVHNLLDIDHMKKSRKEIPEPESAPPEAVLTDLEDSLERPSEGPQVISKDLISDMVLSVRDLSKNLSNLSMKIRMQNILIVSKIHDQSLVAMTRDLAEYLLALDATNNVYVQDIMKDKTEFGYTALLKSKDVSRLKFWDARLCRNSPNLFDLVITLGGDGTVLYTSWLFQKIVPPVLCFGLGSLGFMTEYNYQDRDQIIPGIIKNGLRCSLRMRFECTIMRAKNPEDYKSSSALMNQIEGAQESKEFEHHSAEETYCILNDVVVDRGPNPSITTTELYGDFNFVTAIEADGVVISTPSGSTAYSLSAGGSLVHPDIPGILVSPICPHTLSFRPLVVPDTLVVALGVPYDARSTAWCSLDGKFRVELRRGDFLTVSASPFPFPMVQDGKSSTNWFSRLSQTLHWNERKRQQAFS